MKTQFVLASLRRVAFAATFMLCAALAAPVRAQRSGVPAGVQQLNDFSYRVWASNPTKQRGQVRLVDLTSGQVLYNARSSAVSFGQQFEVSQLPDGRYAFVVNVGAQQYRYVLHLRTAATRSVELRADTVRTRGALAARL